jgi:hypothetical protein
MPQGPPSEPRTEWPFVRRQASGTSLARGAGLSLRANIHPSALKDAYDHSCCSFKVADPPAAGPAGCARGRARRRRTGLERFRPPADRSSALLTALNWYKRRAHSRPGRARTAPLAAASHGASITPFSRR